MRYINNGYREIDEILNGVLSNDDESPSNSVFNDVENPSWQKPKSTEMKYLVDQINNRYYKLINIPDVMAKRSDFELDSSTFGAIKQPFGYEVGWGRYSINWMIQNFSRGVPFEFEDWKDCVIVANTLQAYIKALENDLEFVAETVQSTKDEDIKIRYDEAHQYLEMAKFLAATLVPMSKRLENYHTPPKFKDVVAKRRAELQRQRLGIDKEPEKKHRFSELTSVGRR